MTEQTASSNTTIITDAARITVNVRDYLREVTGEQWPALADDERYARLLLPHLEGARRAFGNLRAAHRTHFSDPDLQQIVAFAALGVADAAFTKLRAEEYWKIGLLGHEALSELDALAPEVTQPIKAALQQALAPFRFFADSPPDLVLRATLLAAILAQHRTDWRAAVGPGAQPLCPGRT